MPYIPVPATEAAKAFERACADLDRVEWWRRFRGTALGVAAALSIPGTASGWVWYATHPLVLIQEKVVPLGPNNVPLAAYDPAALPLPAQTDQAVNTAWRFVRAMEGYSANREDEDWAIATQLLQPKAAEAFKRERDPRNKDSRAARYKRRYEIRIERDSEVDVCDADRCDPGIDGYMMRYHRVVWDSDQQMEVERILFESVVRFRRNVEGFTWSFVVQHNAARIQVFSYTRGQALGAVNTRFPG